MGFVISSKSILLLAKRLLYREYNIFEYLLTYRFSQDQFEMFFPRLEVVLDGTKTQMHSNLSGALLQKNNVTPQNLPIVL